MVPSVMKFTKPSQETKLQQGSLAVVSKYENTKNPLEI